ncbi:hypothetical protein Rleg4DRAFT_3501 [Rhizobium leguminosarum bv. trifolii WSM2297]|uniref:Uncharacterized protein n=1 Tax=Rhizobium leguminosarum bv. trifolii WSM2297 TaxID=754762 RepID=J0CET5_RHILT|nr:hypothetical protein Rleg4DRAFT_3501 [Rhizobium leguminosarum bv. trifolii WSM2297]
MSASKILYPNARYLALVREWMEKNTYLPVHKVVKDGDVVGRLNPSRVQLVCEGILYGW